MGLQCVWLRRLLLTGAAFLLGQAAAAANAELPFRVATFNIEWLGYPENSGSWYGSRARQLEWAAEEIGELNADVIALQEVIVDSLNGDALTDLLVLLREAEPAADWQGAFNPKFSFWWDPDFADYPAQRQAFIWRGSKVELMESSVLVDWIPAWDRRFGSGRLPFRIEVRVGDRYSGKTLSLVNLHLKCCRGSDDRRHESMTTLLAELRADYAAEPMIVLGDYNVADAGGANGEIADWGMYADADADGEADFVHAAGAVADLYWDDIDHIVISDELVEAYERVPVAGRSERLGSAVSDHGPVLLNLALPVSLGEAYEVWAEEVAGSHTQFAQADEAEADPDQDGLANYLEFALGTDPLSGESSEPVPDAVATGADALEIHYRKRVLAAGDPVQLMEGSLDGGQIRWSAVDSGRLESGEVDDDGFQTIRLRISPRIGTAQFFRLEGAAGGQ